MMQTESQGFRTCRRADCHQEVHDHTICSTSYSMYIHLHRISAASRFLRVASLLGRIVLDTSGHGDMFTSCAASEDAHVPAETLACRRPVILLGLLVIKRIHSILGCASLSGSGNLDDLRLHEELHFGSGNAIHHRNVGTHTVEERDSYEGYRWNIRSLMSVGCGVRDSCQCSEQCHAILGGLRNRGPLQALPCMAVLAVRPLTVRV